MMLIQLAVAFQWFLVLNGLCKEWIGSFDCRHPDELFSEVKKLFVQTNIILLVLQSYSQSLCPKPLRRSMSYSSGQLPTTTSSIPVLRSIKIQSQPCPFAHQTIYHPPPLSAAHTISLCLTSTPLRWRRVSHVMDHTPSPRISLHNSKLSPILLATSSSCSNTC